MKRLRKILLIVTSALLVLILVSLAWSWVKRWGEPKYEGRTAEQWLDHFAKLNNGVYGLGELDALEQEVVFRSLGHAGQEVLLEELFAYKPSAGFHTNLYRLGEVLPAEMRYRFLRDPVNRRIVAESTLEILRPDWEVVEPYVTAAISSGESNQLLRAVSALGKVGRGASNGIPVLMAARTNNVGWLPQLALQSMMQLGTNALPALPALISDLEEHRWNNRHLRIMMQLGPVARAAVPALERLLARDISGSGKTQVAAALVAIDPDHQVAREYLQTLLDAGLAGAKTAIDVSSAVSPLWSVHAPNPTVVDLLEHAAAGHGWRTQLLQVLIQHDPDLAVSVLRGQLTNVTEETDVMEQVNAVWVLLRYNPNDPVALAFIRDNLPDANTSSHGLGDPWGQHVIGGLRYCTSESPGALEMLDEIEKLDLPDRVADYVREVRRQIELNDQLKELRATASTRE